VKLSTDILAIPFCDGVQISVSRPAILSEVCRDWIGII